MEVKDLCQAFNAKLAESFPDCYIHARPATLIGEELILITFANVERPEDSPNRILENANGFMKFMVEMNPDMTQNGYMIESPTMHYRDKLIRFRVIKAATQAAAMDKLVAWFKKNHDIIKASKPSYR